MWKERLWTRRFLLVINKGAARRMQECAASGSWQFIIFA
ncbi:hypothetical protein ESCCO14588_4204 [Escherichia coli O157:H7 str. TW14588]|uniref:Uncharacterized protein n=1 Tax=Escherichia coli O157:H7 (strain EC869) TaxID=478008 RepID=A0A0H3PGM8_ECO5C|nr:hypothetical protein ECH74115_2709 [Escherichia coli O157:H7 str. EC4115]EDU73323.1 hypothetical protein ECH7EC4401_5335 [Escherichia coli O157:H7 str. EC4401]EDU83976.1 hypothetical protein ECH7EC4501_3875 [Escherichia coli O157:H7 str. EC4501]EDU88620.1 hypothetical protein ECH7EC869_2247 [Escherichia coli O157:H7 str. EC869]EDU94142.1 hypothetical protein ECH7EC508_5875 [Escherichia coli O157:H7 str. EC508]EDZ79928.1 hypothetical protein ECH7EC4045_A3429 [Escherichia coli O157:H7 str. EC